MTQNEIKFIIMIIIIPKSLFLKTFNGPLIERFTKAALV